MGAIIYEYSQKARVLLRRSPFRPSLIFVGKVRSLPTPLSDPIKYIQASLASIRLGCKGLPGTNALAYNKNTTEKSFVTLAPGGNALKHFFFVKIAT